MIERLKTLGAAPSPKARRIVLGLAVLAVLALAVRTIHHRMTHVDVDDARIAAEMVTLASRTPGWLTARPVREGDRIRASQVLGEVDADTARLSVDAQQAGLAGAEAEVARLERLIGETRASTQAALQEARSDLTSARQAQEQSHLNATNAQDDFQRDQDLVARHFESPQQAQHSRITRDVALREQDKAAAAVAAAQARVAKAQAAAQLDSLMAQKDQAQAAAQELRAKVGLSQQDVHDLRLTSPIDGVVDRTFANVGDFLDAGQRVMLLHDPSQVWVEANVKETDLEKVHLGAPATVVVDAYPDRSFEARVSLIGNSATSTFALLPSPNPSGNFTKITQRIPIRLAIRQDGLLLKPGMMVEVSIDSRS